MLDPKVFENLSATLTKLMQGPKDLPGQEAMQQQVKSLLQSSFAKLDLVTREEFEAQKAVLTRTREKLDAIEAQLAVLEARQTEDNDPQD